jgi:starch-binding outer membrane protein, SusD/RagB family
MRKSVNTIKVIALILLSSGCEQFLENIDPPNTQISSELVFASDVTATSAVVGMYLNMLENESFASGSNLSITALTGLSSDELIEFPRTNYNAIEFERNMLRKENEQVYSLWKTLFKSIYQANAIIEGLAVSSGLTDKVKHQLEGEALFIRAFCNFYLINLYGEAPLISTTDYGTNAKISRSSVETMYDKIVDDLLAAQELLQAKYTNRDAHSGEERVRPNKFTAVALLARVYLFRGNWQAAEEQSTQIIDNIALYELTVLESVFLRNSREAIWQLAPVYPNFNTKEGYYFVGLGLQYNVLKDDVINSFEPLDNRKAEWIQTSGAVSFPYKYKQGTNPAASVTEYSMVFRLAEQYLIRAEARAQQNKLAGTNGAESDINIIRNRAGLGNTTAATKDEILAAIEQERRVELFTEWGHRWFDLKRWDRANAVLGPKKPEWSETNMLYPVPQQEINKNLNLLPQNPGY